MSRTSYPSPVSSTNSPEVDEIIGQTATTDLELVREHGETQRSLHQASAALEAAYSRIRQVRRSLLQLSDAFPPADLTRNGQVDPGHTAIILAGAPNEGLTRGETGLDTRSEWRDIVSREEDQLTSRTHLHPHDANVGSPRPNHILPPSLNSPISPPRNTSQRSSIEHQLSRHNLAYRDDPSTSLGRHIAAREALRNSSTTEGPAHEDLIYTALLRSDDDLDHLRSLERARRSEPARLESLYENGLSIRESRITRSLDNNELRRAAQNMMQSPGVANSPWRLPERRRERPDSRSRSGRNTGSDQSERLSLLSNFSVQNLATPQSGSFSRPLLFDEPASYLHSRSNTQDVEDREEIREDRPLGRNYVVHRRVGTNGDELVYNINLDAGDDDSVWLLPSRDRLDRLQNEPSLQEQLRSRLQSRRINDMLRDDSFSPGISNSNGSSPLGNVPRQRGWARLDLDGDEIPYDEEEALERSRTEYRIRALYQAQASRSDTLPEPTQSSIDFPSYSDYPSRETRRYYGSVMDSVLNVPNDGYRLIPVDTWSPEPEFSRRSVRVNPLPMPLSEMVQMPPKTQEDRYIISVPRYASLAGR